MILIHIGRLLWVFWIITNFSAKDSSWFICHAFCTFQMFWEKFNYIYCCSSDCIPSLDWIWMCLAVGTFLGTWTMHDLKQRHRNFHDLSVLLLIEMSMICLYSCMLTIRSVVVLCFITNNCLYWGSTGHPSEKNHHMRMCLRYPNA